MNNLNEIVKEEIKERKSKIISRLNKCQNDIMTLDDLSEFSYMDLFDIIEEIKKSL